MADRADGRLRSGAGGVFTLDHERMEEGELHQLWTEVGRYRVHTRLSSATVRPEVPVLVLVHGLVISSLYMVPTARRLAGAFPLFAPDLPGFGLSGKPPATLTIEEHARVLAASAVKLSLPLAVWVGNSFGCQVIAELAVRAPALVRAAVLAGPTMDPHARTAPRQIARWLLDWTRERPSLAAMHARDYYEAGLGRAWGTFRDALANPIERKLPGIQAPVLVERRAGFIVPQRWAEEAAALLPRGELVVIPGAPHVVNYTTPEPFRRSVAEFAGRV